MAETVLVAGATGYVGRYVVRELKERGFRVKALTRDRKRLDEAGPFDSPAVGKYCDEVFVGEATRAETLSGIGEGVDLVFSSLGISRQRDGLSFEDVDHLANCNILTQAKLGGARKMVYVSLFDPEPISHLAIVRAHEKTVRAIAESGIEHTIIRPSGFFSDMEVLLDMAKRGRVILVGDGYNRFNPIHGSDLARVCADAMTSDARELAAGGPDVMSQREAAEIAFKVVNKKPRYLAIPIWLARGLGRGVGMLSPQFGDLIDFIATAGEIDAVAPQVGKTTLESHFRTLLRTSS